MKATIFVDGDVNDYGRAYAVIGKERFVHGFGLLVDARGKTDADLLAWAEKKRKTRMQAIELHIAKLDAQVATLSKEWDQLSAVNEFVVKRGWA